MRTISIDGNSLTLEEVAAVAREGARVRLAPAAHRAMVRARAVVDTLLHAGGTAYGVNTGFGHLADVRIAPKDLKALQTNLIRSHACGVGPPLPQDAVRAML